VKASRSSRLDVVLRVRRLAEDRAKAEFGAAAGRLASARAGQQAARRRLVSEQEYLGGLQVRAATGGDLVAATTALSIADELVEAADRAISGAMTVVAEARARLADATRARNVVERLRDRVLDAERLEAERREIAELGELAGVRHAWRTLEGEAA
jgi:flagellar export protein FliJ